MNRVPNDYGCIFTTSASITKIAKPSSEASTFFGLISLSIYSPFEGFGVRWLSSACMALMSGAIFIKFGRAPAIRVIYMVKKSFIFIPSRLHLAQFFINYSWHF